jgi:hypothetical protein
MTPFVLISFFLIADTSRVFFTRLASKKSPMTPDTIHFHHLILQQSGSYLAATSSIYFTTLISVITAVLSFNYSLSSNIMLIHLSLIMIFILVPPVKVYMPFLTQLVRPLYNWQKISNLEKPSLFRTIFMELIFIVLIISLFLNSNFSNLISWGDLSAILLLIIFLFLNRNDIIAMYVLQITTIFFIIDLKWNVEIDIFTKLFSLFQLVSYIIFTLERRKGCAISKFSSIDLLLLICISGGIFLSIVSYSISFWLLIVIFAVWFSIRFIFYRAFNLA